MTSEVSDANGIVTYQYDANGSLTIKENPGKFRYQYGYDLRNRLASASITRKEGSNDVAITSSYAYNTDGIRTRALQTINGVTQNRYFLLDSGHTGYSQVFEETSTLGGNVVRSYVLGDDVLSQNVNGVTSHLLYDGHGSTRQLTGADGSVTERYAYDAYGRMLGGNPNVTDRQSATDLLYAGEQFDPGLQMEYLRARYYDQDNGRFNRLDPFEGYSADPQSLHKYAYAHCDPINGIDPSGYFKIPHSMLNLARKVGWKFAILILVGIAAHKKICQDYTKVHDREKVFCNSPFTAMIGQSHIPVPGAKRRPDILNATRREIYEIKSGFTYGLDSAARLAGVQLSEYVDILSNIVEYFGGPIGNLPETIRPGLWQPKFFYYLSPAEFPYILPITIYACLWEPGCIVYFPGPEVFIYMAMIQLAIKIPQIAAYHQQRLAIQTNNAMIFTLFGIL